MIKINYIVRFFIYGILLLLITSFWLDDFNEENKIIATIVAKDILATGGKYPTSKTVFALKDDNGKWYEEDVSYLTYVRFNLGDRVIIKRTNYELNPEAYSLFKNSLGLVSHLILLFALLYEWIFYKERGITFCW